MTLTTKVPAIGTPGLRYEHSVTPTGIAELTIKPGITRTLTSQGGWAMDDAGGGGHDGGTHDGGGGHDGGGHGDI